MSSDEPGPSKRGNSGRGDPQNQPSESSSRYGGAKRQKKLSPDPDEKKQFHHYSEEEGGRRERSPPESSEEERRRQRVEDTRRRKRPERSPSGSHEETRPYHQSEETQRSRRYERSPSEEERRPPRHWEERYRGERREYYRSDTSRGKRFHRYCDYPYGSQRRGGPRLDTGRDPEQPGPSWAGQSGQTPPRFQQQHQQQMQQQQMQQQQMQQQQMQQQQPSYSQAQPQESYQSHPQQYQARPQQPSQSWGEQEEAVGGDFTSRMSGLNVDPREEEEAWGQVPRRAGRVGGAWGQPQPPQQYQRPPQVQPPFQRLPPTQPPFQRPPQMQPPFQRPPLMQPAFQQQGAWPRPPQGQSRPQPRQQYQESQTMSQPRYEQQQVSAPGAAGAWAKGPPQEFQRLAQEKSARPVPEKASQRSSERPSQPQPDESKAKKRQESRTYPETRQSSDYLEFAPRICAPQKTGRSIEVYANFFPLRLENYDITVYHYDLVFEPEVPKSLLRRAWNKSAELHFPSHVTVFDGMSNVYSKGPLVNGATFRGELPLYHPDSGKSKEYAMMIKEVRRIQMNTLTNYREKLSKSTTLDARKKALPLAEVSVIEVILKNWPANNLIQHNRVFFPKMDMQPRTCQLSDRLELRYGYFQSAFLGYKLYLNFDVAHRPFYKSDYVKSLVRDLGQGRMNYIQDEANHFLKGAKIEYTLPDDRKMKMVYRANKLVESANVQSFEREGQSMTVAEYFAKEKNYRLRNPNLPLLWVGPTTKTIYLPLELVRLADDQIYKGALNSSETRKMVSGATTDARRRKTETLQAFTRANFHDNPFLKEFGISISREMESVKARVLEPPKLKTNTVITVKEGAWKTRSFMDAKSFNKWCILNLDKSVDRNSLINLQKSLQAKAREFNMHIGEPAASPKDHGGVISYFELQKIFSILKGMTIVIVVIADTKGLYSRVKTICETQEGILTQCIRGRNITSDPRKIMTTLDNLLLKINAKLGGTNHCLNRTSSPPCLEGYSMVVGADVTHAGPGSKIPSVAAVAACCEVSAFQYGITIRVQNGEIIQDLKDIMRINLHNFARIRKRFPDKIFFFRDGVSEGEMEKVLKTEYKAIKDACDGLGVTVKITLLVVQKRHHTRFFPTSQTDEEGKTYNVPVGTCVDSDIVHPGGLDFYLLSHGSLLGTARPTRYRLLHDDNRLTDDELEQLTFYLCHLYSRCNRSVSYPSPTYNAHLAAFRARAYLEGLNLTDKDDLKQVQSKLKDAISHNYPMFFV